MAGRKAFLANPRHYNRVSPYGEHDCSAKKNNLEFYEYPSLSHFTNEH